MTILDSYASSFPSIGWLDLFGLTSVWFAMILFYALHGRIPRRGLMIAVFLPLLAAMLHLEAMRADDLTAGWETTLNLGIMAPMKAALLVWITFPVLEGTFSSTSRSPSMVRICRALAVFLAVQPVLLTSFMQTVVVEAHYRFGAVDQNDILAAPSSPFFPGKPKAIKSEVHWIAPSPNRLPTQIAASLNLGLVPMIHAWLRGYAPYSRDGEMDLAIVRFTIDGTAATPWLACLYKERKLEHIDLMVHTVKDLRERKGLDYLTRHCPATFNPNAEPLSPRDDRVIFKDLISAA